MGLLRLDKYLADAGRGTRSEVKLLIKYGRVRIGDRVVKRPEEKVDADKDSVFVDGQPVCYSEFEYYMLNKPAGVVSAVTDKRDKTVVQLIDTEKRRDLFPVGRLDKDTEGLVIITNDGKLANEMLSPKKHVEKTYFAIVRGTVTDDIILRFREGLDIGDDRITRPAELKLTEPLICEGAAGNLDNEAVNNEAASSETVENEIAGNEAASSETVKNEIVGNEAADDEVVGNEAVAGDICHVEITITEGRFHQIKRMFQAVGMEVVYLKRLSMGGVVLDETLPCGSWRRLSEEEIGRAYGGKQE